MVIFGAGASHDVDPTMSIASLPALSDALFSSERYSSYQRHWPDFRGILKELRIASQGQAAGAPALEDVLQRYQTEADEEGDEDRQIQLASVRFYLRELARQWSGSGIGSLENNYVSLLDKIHHRRMMRDDKPVVLVSFNYDTLLETAIQVILHTVSPSGDSRSLDVDEYVLPGSPYVILKPHGSWQWGREVVDHSAIKSAPIGPTDLIRSVARLKFGSRFAIVDHHLEVVRASDGLVLFPSIALPVRSKAFAWPDVHGRTFDDFLPKVTHLITVGWRAQEDHFLSLWAAHPGDLRGIQVVTKTEAGAAQVAERLKSAGIQSSATETFHGGFTAYNDYLRGNPLDDFLRR